MNHWTGQDDGSVIGVATDRALEWAGSDRHKLASIAFVAFARDFGFAPVWRANEWNVTTLHHPWDRPRDFTVLLDTSTDPDLIVVPPQTKRTMYALVRIIEATPPVVHILGFEGVLHQLHERFGHAFPRSQVGRMREYIPHDIWRKHNFPEAQQWQRTPTATSPSEPTSQPSS